MFTINAVRQDQIMKKNEMNVTDAKNVTLNELQIWLEGKDDLKSLPFVVTGSSGFIGCNIVSALSSLGWNFF